jgi:LPS O-antigen subunit length determinant protein (WzzB/FepE family)
MQTTVKLQEPFSYSIWPVILFAIFFVFCLLFLLLFSRKKKQKIVVVAPPKEEKKSIQEKYLQEIQSLKILIEKKEISNRAAYQKLSSIIRTFIFEMTKIKVQNYTLEELKQVPIPVLYELIQEYYHPEFAEISEGNIFSSLEKTKEVIQKWN